MNRKNLPNNKKNILKRNQKNVFFIITSGIAAIFLLIAIVLFAKKETNSEINSPEKEPFFTEEKNTCPFYDEKNNLIVEEKESLKDDYQALIPAEIKAKIKARWAENIYELRELVLGGKLT